MSNDTPPTGADEPRRDHGGDTPPASDRTAMLTLLDGLLAGAATPLLNADDWAARLDGPLAARFVAQLRAEWLPLPAPDAFCAEVAEHVRRHLSVWHPGWPHLWAHVLRVGGTALALAEEAGIDPALAHLATMCHDIAKLDQYRTGAPHEDIGASFAGKILDGHLAPADIRSIQQAILQTGTDALAHVLTDADRLDKVGAAGAVRRISLEGQRSWLTSALWRIRNDARHLPAMHFAHSRALAAHKLAFLDWFLPAAEAAIAPVWR